MANVNSCCSDTLKKLNIHL
uniref:Uncharacterized protein n=1 Tax=Rhizophora mucronata TaxID=61149 RepID=A0A2P2R3G1_RHIMU